MNAPWALPLEELRFNPDGLIPAIAQDWLDGAVLMLAWMNRQALAQTLASHGAVSEAVAQEMADSL